MSLFSALLFVSASCPFFAHLFLISAHRLRSSSLPLLSQPCPSFPLLCLSSPRHAPHFLFISFLFIAYPFCFFAIQFRCDPHLINAFPPQSYSIPQLILSTPCRSGPLQFLCASPRYIAVPSPSISKPFQRRSFLPAAIPPPYSSRAPTSSQVNRPFPLFRHWPNPRSFP